MMPGMDTRVTTLASSQHAVASRAQLRDLGLTDRQIDRHVREGRLDRLHLGVYAIPGAPATWHQALMAATLAAGPEAAASHRSAARLRGFDGPWGSGIEVTVPVLDKPRPKDVVVHRSTDLSALHVTTMAGIPVTRPHRTLVDLGAVVRQGVLDRAVDDALAKGAATYEGLLATLDEVGRRGRRGVGPLRKSLAERTDAPETVLEAEFQRLVHRAGLPEPVYQYQLHDDRGRFVARIDAAYPDLRLAIELDGAATRVGRHALEYDINRQNRIVDCGFLVRRYGWRGVVGAPEKTVTDLFRTIDRRRNELCLPAAS